MWRRLSVFAAAIAIVAVPLSACATPRTGAGAAPLTSSSPTVTETPSETPATGATDEPTPGPTASDSPAPSASAPTITVTIANSGADDRGVFASGLVTGATGAEGTCTLTATAADGRVLEAQAAAHATPAALNCGIIRIAAGSGDWSLVLSFASEASTGSSDPVAVHRS